MTRAASRQNPTRIQREKTEAILAAALDVFSTHGFRGATLDQIAEAAGISKPNLLYYFASKDDVHRMLLERLLDTWLEPLRQLDPAGDPAGRDRRLHPPQARDGPRLSRARAGSSPARSCRARRTSPTCSAARSRRWSTPRPASSPPGPTAGRIAPVDPHHLIVSIWAVTQHYADFDAQLDAVLGPDDAARFRDAEALPHRPLRPRAGANLIATRVKFGVARAFRNHALISSFSACYDISSCASAI